MWKNTAEPRRSQVTMWRMRIAFWIPKATYKHTEYVILLFHCNNGCTNAPRCYVTRTVSVLFIMVYYSSPTTPHYGVHNGEALPAGSK